MSDEAANTRRIRGAAFEETYLEVSFDRRSTMMRLLVRASERLGAPVNQTDGAALVQIQVIARKRNGG